MRDSETESSLNLNLIVPVALLAVLLIVPFSINALLHLLSPQRQVAPVIMKIPVDNAAITIPSSAKQYESFEVALNLETLQLAKVLNEIVSSASEGTSYQGIVGTVSSNMRAEITGKNWLIDREGAQEPVSTYQGLSNWRWRVTPESSGQQELTLQLHLMTQDGSQLNNKILDLAEANLLVQANWSEWLKRNGLWIAILGFLLFAASFQWRRYRSVR
ncbi:hypothetical protein W03_02860 [Nitrosomonas sp. PY1]|uniref:hypothetical protein n=1 Tax=Nitrosomonas sp. PY1 TaxID=1803906 RepID=UPI001FC88082|nr:hypothetical protein [Nitrosomonas sp. PY1]GKS68282.1 hypothetical protein W03_02860 [Nitrosomonas sp. PY1]